MAMERSKRVYLRRAVNLQREQVWLIERVARERGLGKRGFSAALRQMINEWVQEHEQEASQDERA